jgi:hypothetical protein
VTPWQNALQEEPVLLRKVFPGIALVALLAAPHCPAPRVVTFEAPSRASTWERFEVLGFAWHHAANPYDPAAVDLRGEFEAPDGERFEMPGFVTQEFVRELVGGFEKRRHAGVRARARGRVREAPRRERSALARAVHTHATW